MQENNLRRNRRFFSVLLVRLSASRLHASKLQSDFSHLVERSNNIATRLNAMHTLRLIRERRTEASAINMLMLLPRKHRSDIECDIRDDIKDMRKVGLGEFRIRFHVLWQFAWALWALYGAKFLKLIGVVAFMSKLGK